jgi:hypothetical protein
MISKIKVAILLLGCTIAVISILGCAPAVRPTQILTPQVNCGQYAPPAIIPPIPDLSGMDAWAIQVMGIYQVEVTKRKAEDKCLGDLRSKGVIR